MRNGLEKYKKKKWKTKKSEKNEANAKISIVPKKKILKESRSIFSFVFANNFIMRTEIFVNILYYGRSLIDRNMN